MDDQPKYGGYAFPHPGLGDPRFKSRAGDEGMSLRDYFAAQALIGIMTLRPETTTAAAWGAYQAADAMMEARK